MTKILFSLSFSEIKKKSRNSIYLWFPPKIIIWKLNFEILKFPGIHATNS